MPCFEYNVDPYQPASQKVTDPESMFTSLPLNQPFNLILCNTYAEKLGLMVTLMCSTVQEQITTCGQNAIVKIGERTNIRPQKWLYKLLIKGLTF